VIGSYLFCHCTEYYESKFSLCAYFGLIFKYYIGFTYLKSLKVAKGVKLPASASGCKCKDKCIDPNTCECAKRNGFEFPYVSKDGGRLETLARCYLNYVCCNINFFLCIDRLIEAKDVVFECGPNCGCGPECVNRTSQRGLQYRLEVVHY